MFYSGDSIGAVWAFRQEDTPLNTFVTFEEVFQKPNGALENFMEAIEGDGTPWSYLSASLFALEAPELGASGYGRSWSTHRILGAEPTPGLESFKWSAPKPEMWLPSCRIEGDTVTVQFYSFSALGWEQIFQHRNTYQKGSYSFKAECQAIAAGGQGFVF